MLETIIFFVVIISIAVIVVAVGSLAKKKKLQKQVEKSVAFSLTAEQLRTAVEKEDWQEKIVDDPTKSVEERMCHIFDARYGSLADYEKYQDRLWDYKKEEKGK